MQSHLNWVNIEAEVLMDLQIVTLLLKCRIIITLLFGLNDLFSDQKIDIMANNSRKLMILVFLILLVRFNTVSSAQEKINAVALHGVLMVKEGRIVNANGQAPQLRGISLSWSIWAGQKYYNPAVVKWLKDDFNINLLRVAMAVEPDSGYLRDPIGQEQLIVETIDAAIEENIYVLIDWHDHHADRNLPQAKQFFSKMAKKYAGKPHVIYEIWNEPEKVEWQVVKDYAQEVITEIRKYDPENLIVVGSPSWDQHVDVAAKDPIKGFKNIAYSFHFYASQPSHQEGLMAKADEAISLGLPLFVTEWGVGEANGDGVFDHEKTEKWMNWMEKNKLSWVNWNLTDKPETTGLLKTGAALKGNWPVSDLSPAGLYIRTVLRKLNLKNVNH
jgi:endoglucanase